MAKNGFKAMDSDMHVFEPADLWQRYIDKRYLDRAPKGLNRAFRDLGVEVEGKILPIPRQPENPALAKYRQSFFEEKYREAGMRNFDGVSQIQAMDKEGLDIAFLFPTRALTVLGIDGLDPDFASAIARAYNDWLHDFSKTDPKRLFGVAMVAPHDISGAIEEIRRTVTEYGFRGIFLRPNHVNQKNGVILTMIRSGPSARNSTCQWASTRRAESICRSRPFSISVRPSRCSTPLGFPSPTCSPAAI